MQGNSMIDCNYEEERLSALPAAARACGAGARLVARHATLQPRCRIGGGDHAQTWVVLVAGVVDQKD